MRPMKSHLYQPVVLLLGAVALIGACSKEHDLSRVKNPLDPSVTGVTPPTPHDLRVVVGSRQIELSWSLAKTDSTTALLSTIDKYRIYRRSADALTPTVVDSAATSPALMRDLTNGREYGFSVATVLKGGLEGKRSAEITTTPALFGVQIENGKDPINSSNVNLNLLAPTATTGVELSNSSDFPGSVPKPFTASQVWQLPPGEGRRVVFARFLDAVGNTSIVVSDSVTVDLRAEIRDLTFSKLTALPGHPSMQPGDTLRFLLTSGEANGQATVQLGTGGRRLQLRDDGQEGDATAADGIYTLNYVAEDDLDLIDGIVTGSFTDQAGNQAPNRVAAERLTVHRNLPAVELRAIAVLGPDQLFLSWTQATDAGRFSAYRVFRADSSPVDGNPSARQVREITTRTQTTYTDSGLEANHTYYYVVYVVDAVGFPTPSNEESATPRSNPPPDAVTLNPPTNVTENAVSLSWTQSLAADFFQYRIYRGARANMEGDSTRRLLTSISSASTTTYDDRTELEQGMTYWYQVEVANSSGSATLSNPVSATILDKPPIAVTLNTPTSVGETSVVLTWTKNTELDFADYELRRGRNLGVSPESLLVDSVTTVTELSGLDHQGLVENTDYWYRVFVTDKGGQQTGSNEIKVTTKNADPIAVTLTLQEDVGAAHPTVDLTWSASADHDFQDYRVYRDTSPAVEESATLVRTISDANVIAYIDADPNLEDNTKYYYRVFVHDTGGAKTGSLEQSILLHNRPPTPVTLQEAVVDSVTIRLTWSQNANTDFDRYEVLKTTDPNILPDSLIATLNYKTHVNYTWARPEHDPLRYYFMIRVWDKAVAPADSSRSADSNVISARVKQ